MTTTTEAAPDEVVDAEIVPTLAQLIAEQLCSSHLIDGSLVGLRATALGDDVVLDVTRWELQAEHDTGARVLLHLEPLTAAPAESSEVGVRDGIGVPA